MTSDVDTRSRMVAVNRPQGRPMQAYFALPEGTGPFPGVVVIHEIYRLNENIKDIARRFTGEGYAALAVDLFSTAGRVMCMARIFHGMLIRPVTNGVVGDLRAALAVLAADSAVDPNRLGVIGFCMGGGFALLSAPRFDFAAASVNYGEVPDDAVQRLAGACPVVASYGARDRRLRGHATKLESALQTLGVDHDVKEYPNAGHSFMNRLSGPALNPVLKFIGLNYHHPSAEDSWRRILSFFDAHLGAGSAEGAAG